MLFAGILQWPKLPTLHLPNERRPLMSLMRMEMVSLGFFSLNAAMIINNIHLCMYRDAINRSSTKTTSASFDRKHLHGMWALHVTHDVSDTYNFIMNEQRRRKKNEKGKRILNIRRTFRNIQICLQRMCAQHNFLTDHRFTMRFVYHAPMCGVCVFYFCVSL